MTRRLCLLVLLAAALAAPANAQGATYAGLLDLFREWRAFEEPPRVGGHLRQPGYGASYVTGGRLMEEAIAERARQLGDQFSMRRFFDEVDSVGMIPVSLVYWELTGDDRMVRELEAGVGPLPLR